jgi:hypothetical protein
MQCLNRFRADECMVFSDQDLLPGTRWIPNEPIRTIRDYEAVVLDRLAQETRCDLHLIVQWDGFVLDGQRWDPDFAGYDYVGAPWPHLGNLVGNGGFSLRSRKLLRAVRKLRRTRTEGEPAEDLQICVTLRPRLEAMGLRFPDAAVASRFAVETPGPNGRIESFGFHGAFNFPLVMSERDILEHMPGILMRMGKAPNMWFLFIMNALVRGQLTVARALARDLQAHRAPLWEALGPALQQRGVPAGLLR